VEKSGRPEKPIDWDRVNELLEAGCTGTEIAPHFDIHYTNFYDRVEKKYGISFTDYASKMRQKGDSLLREKQYKKALKGENALLIWLGKNRLGQKDQPEQENFKIEDLEKFTAIMNLLSQTQSGKSVKSDLNIASNNINNADKS
jgi:hypothetical protein